VSLITYPFTADLILTASKVDEVDSSFRDHVKEMGAEKLRDLVVEGTLSYLAGIPINVFLSPYPPKLRDFIASYLADSVELQDIMFRLIGKQYPSYVPSEYIPKHITAVSNEFTSTLPTFLSRHPATPVAQYARAAAIFASSVHASLGVMAENEESRHQDIFNLAIATSIITTMMITPPEPASKYVYLMFTESNFSASFSNLDLRPVKKIRSLLPDFEVEAMLQSIVEDNAQHCSWYASSSFNASADAIYNLYKA